MDFASGATLKTLDDACGVSEILCDEGTVVAVVSSKPRSATNSRTAASAPELAIVAARADSLQLLWKRNLAGLAAETAVLAGGRVFCQIGGDIAAMEANTGQGLAAAA